MSPALANRGAVGFVALLVVLLAAMLLAVIRAPGRDDSPPEDAGDAEDVTWPLPAVRAPSRPVPVPFRPADAQARAVDAQARAAAVIARAAAVLPARPAPGRQPGDAAAIPLPAAAAGQPAHARYPARHVADALPRPQVTGGPPWEPAPMPPGVR